MQVREQPKVSIECEVGDAQNVEADVLVMKYAQTFYGVDYQIARTLTNSPEAMARINPGVGKHLLLRSEGRVRAKNVLFLGVPELVQFSYPEIRHFARDALGRVATAAPESTSVAMTLQGVNYGLDEVESVSALLGGLMDAIYLEVKPEFLRRVIIVERDPRRAARVKELIAKHVPQYRGWLLRAPSRVPTLRNAKPDASAAAETLKGAGQTKAPKRHILVAMPFAKEFDDTFQLAIVPAVRSAKFLCERVDLDPFVGDVLERLKQRIDTATYLVADLTTNNANVFLEVGYAWGGGVKTVLLRRTGTERKFDVQGQRCIEYDDLISLKKKLGIELRTLEKNQE